MEIKDQFINDMAIKHEKERNKNRAHKHKVIYECTISFADDNIFVFQHSRRCKKKRQKLDDNKMNNIKGEVHRNLGTDEKQSLHFPIDEIEKRIRKQKVIYKYTMPFVIDHNLLAAFTPRQNTNLAA